MILHEVLKAIIRIEKKLDELLRRQVDENAMHQPLNYHGQHCPLCKRPVRYVPVSSRSEGHYMVRACGCEPMETELPVEGE